MWVTGLMKRVAGGVLLNVAMSHNKNATPADYILEFCFFTRTTVIGNGVSGDALYVPM